MPFKDKAARKAWSEKYYEEHKEEIIAQKREYYEEHKEELNARKREKYKDPEDRQIAQEINRKSRVKNRDKILEKNRSGKRRFQFLTSYAKGRELSCLLTEDQYVILISVPCDYCDNQLGSTINATGVGLDRIDNSRGYEMDNVVSCCVICNRLRGDHLTPEETRIAVKAVIDFRKTKL